MRVNIMGLRNQWPLQLKWLKSRSNEMQRGVSSSKDWRDGVPTGMRTPTLAGLAILAASVAGFGIWAATAPLQSAVVAQGKFVATGKNKIIQHLEGGIVSQIKVTEGDHVQHGAVLVTLDDTSSQANLRLLTHRFQRLKAVQARLVAESQMAAEVVFPASLAHKVLTKGNPELDAIVSRQREEFMARRDKLQSQVAVLEHEVATRREATAGYRAEIASIDAQLKLIDEELANKTLLYKKQLVALPKLLELKRLRAQLLGRSARLSSSIAEEGKNIAKTRGEIIHLRASAVDQAVAELRRVEGEIDDVREQLRKANDILKRVNITAPVNGVIVKLMQHTPGGVIKPGAEILEIVPSGSAPIIEARVKPRDIDQIEMGQSVQVRLTALNQRLTPTVPGKVVYVSADTVEGRRGSDLADGYVVRVTLDTAKVAALEGFHPTPGMPVEAFIKTGERTFFDYLMRPLVDSMARAFRET